MAKHSNVCRLVLEVPGSLALMAPDEFASYVRAKWNLWQNKWRPLDASPTGDEIFEVPAGEPIFLIERSGKHYLMTEGRKVSFSKAA